MFVHRLALFSILLFALLAPAHATPKNFRVGPGCTYATINAALNAERLAPGTPADFIWIARNPDNNFYTAQDIQIHDQNVFLYGGVDNCTDSSISGTTTLSGDGGDAKSVMTISGASQVWLGGLLITQGDNTDSGVGGGINFVGTGFLKIGSSIISNNQAGYGGGINFRGTGSADDVAQLWINYETKITDNTATTSGGGIRIEGNATLRVVDHQVWIARNHADGGFGGGLLVLGPAQANLGSPGYRFAEYVGLLYENTAKNGGGMSVITTAEHQEANVRLFTTDPLHPVRIDGNTASANGGGIYVTGYNGNGASTVCGTDYRISANSAPEGSAIYSAGNGEFELNRLSAFVECSDVHADTLGAQPCTSEDCNLIDGNIAQNASGQATGGSTILLQAGADIFANRLRLRSNRGAHTLRALGGDVIDAGVTILSDCLFDGNIDSSEMVVAGTQTYITLNNCTIADNPIASGAVLRSAGALDLRDDILRQGSTTSLVYTGGNSTNLKINYVMSEEVASLAQGSHVIQADPSFVDPSHGDYRLQPTSPAIDVAPAVASDPYDLDNNPRDRDSASVPNLDGVRDLGAYERQARYCGAADTLFCSNFDFD